LELAGEAGGSEGFAVFDTAGHQYDGDTVGAAEDAEGNFAAERLDVGLTFPRYYEVRTFYQLIEADEVKDAVYS